MVKLHFPHIQHLNSATFPHTHTHICRYTQAIRRRQFLYHHKHRRLWMDLPSTLHDIQGDPRRSSFPSSKLGAHFTENTQTHRCCKSHLINTWCHTCPLACCCHSHHKISGCKFVFFCATQVPLSFSRWHVTNPHHHVTTVSILKMISPTACIYTHTKEQKKRCPAQGLHTWQFV